MSEQGDLFGVEARPPEGFRYQPEVLSRDEEQAILEGVRTLPLRPFEFRAYTGNRRVFSFGWRYDFKEQALYGAEEIPAFLLRARDVAAGFIGIPAIDFVHVLVTEYAPNAGIGWHRDKPVFGEVVGVSLRSPCVFRCGGECVRSGSGIR